MKLQGVRTAWPAKTDLKGWLNICSDVQYYMDEDGILDLHTALHRVFGDQPSDAILESEQELSQLLRGWGIEHRYDDALSRAAGTYVENPVEPAIMEAKAYLRRFDIGTQCVTLYQEIDGGPIYVGYDADLLPEVAQRTLLRGMNKQMPPGIVLKPLPKKAKDSFIQASSAYRLELEPTWYAAITVEAWKDMVETAPRAITMKSDSAHITVQQLVRREVIQKNGVAEQYVLGPVLIPNIPDTQNQIYSPDETAAACHWWAENSGRLAIQHTLQGGKFVNDEIQTLENYVLPCDWKVNDELTLPMGTWMLGARINDAEAWAQTDAGQFKCWSIGAIASVYDEPN